MPSRTYHLTDSARDAIARLEGYGVKIPARTRAMMLEADDAEMRRIAAEARRAYPDSATWRR